MTRLLHRSCSFVFFLLLVFLLLVSTCLAAETQWIEVRSSHFSLVTDAGEKKACETLLRFEQMRTAFGSLMTKARVNLPVPLQIVAFHTGKEMTDFVPLWKGKPTQAAGMFEGNDDRTFIVLDLSVNDPWQVVLHEYAHQLLNPNTGFQFQPWFDEGFAEFFAGIRINGKEATMGAAPERYLQLLRQEKLMKVADLFRVQRGSSTYNETGDHRSLFYAESWLVVHYLYDKQLFSKLDLYFDLAQRKGVPTEDAIRQGFGISAADFDLILGQYLSAQRFHSYKVAVQPGTESSIYKVTPLTQAEVRTVLADMHLHSPAYRDKARGEFEEVLKIQPQNAAALRGLGYSYLLQQDFARAEAYFAKALEGAPDDPRLLYYSSLMIEQQEGPGLGNDRQELEVIQKRLEKAVTLDPEFADAYCRLAFTYVSQGNAEDALKAMTKAARLNPRRQDYALNLAEIYLFNHRTDDAIALLAPLNEIVEPRFAEQTKQLLERARSAKRGLRAALSAKAQPLAGIGQQAAIADSGPAGFLKGELVDLDCSAQPEAVLTVAAGNQTWKFHARDGTRVIVIGAQRLSCEWTDRKVAVNYRQTGKTTGELVSVELQ